jgi:SAM-dependent methyltransferase
LETVHCDLCGSKNNRAVATQTDLIHKSTKQFFTIVECQECGLNFTNPRPSATEIGDFYTKSYSYHSKDGLLSILKSKILGPLSRWVANSTVGYIFELIPPISNLLGSKVRPLVKDTVLRYIKEREIRTFLDIGCGSGLKAHFWGSNSSLIKCSETIKVFGCEPAESARNFLTAKGITCWSKIDDIEESKKFDLIRLNWSLEHVHSPSAYFDFINNHLSENGRAVIAVPNFQGLIYRLSKSCSELPIHLFHFSQDSLMKYASKHDLEVTNSFTFSYPGMFYFSQDIGLLSPELKFSRGITFSKQFQKVLNVFDSSGMGNDIVVTIKRKEAANAQL